VSGICRAAVERAVRDVTAARGVDEPPADDREWVGLFARAIVTALSGYVHAQVQAQAQRPASPPRDALDEILRRLDAIEARLAG
jgi:hypothetical protein